MSNEMKQSDIDRVVAAAEAWCFWAEGRFTLSVSHQERELYEAVMALQQGRGKQ